MASEYKHNYREFRELVLCAPWMIANMHARALLVAQAARDTAPVDETGPHPGLYRESIHVESGIRRGYKARAVGRVIADAPESAFVEWGTERSEGRHTLRNALDVLREV